MPKASPRYSPVGSMLSVKPNDCSQPTLRVPPALTVLAFVEPADAVIVIVIAAAAAATTPITVVSLQIGLFTIGVSPSVTPRRTDGGSLTRPLDDEHGTPLVHRSHRSPRTSSASRRPSPRRLKASVVITRNSPGKSISHQAVS